MEKTVLNIEHQIAAFVNSDNKNSCTVHFDYEHFEESAKGTQPTTGWIVSAHTYNPVTEETFLLKSVEGKTKESALKKILELLKKQKGESPFTVRWLKKGEASVNTHTSYFYCHDILDVVENFFQGKNPEEYVVYEIKLNAIA